MRGVGAALVASILVAGTGAGFAERAKLPKPILPPDKPAAAPNAPPENKPYDPQLMHLAEIMGALTHMRKLCGAGDADAWRARMQALIEAEGIPSSRKDRLAGAYNRGLDGYSLSYRTCTPNARVVIGRFLAEGERIARDIENRYRAT